MPAITHTLPETLLTKLLSLFLRCRTPAHIDQCGAIGHNLMAWAEDGTNKRLS